MFPGFSRGKKPLLLRDMNAELHESIQGNNGQNMQVEYKESCVKWMLFHQKNGFLKIKLTEKGACATYSCILK